MSPGAQAKLCMQGGKAAAETAISMQATGDYSAASTAQYERRWNQLYGYDFGKVRNSKSVVLIQLAASCVKASICNAGASHLAAETSWCTAYIWQA